MLKALLDDQERFAAHLIEACGAKIAMVEEGVERELGKLPKIEGQGAGQLYLAPEMARVFEQAEKLSQKAGDFFVTLEYMLLALTVEPSAAADILKKSGVTAAKLNEAIANVRKGRKAETASAEQGYDALKKYTRDFTEEAKQNK